MVRAILEGRKTQTRRVVKPQPPSIEAVHAKAGIGYHWHAPQRGIDHWRPIGPVWAVREFMGQEPELRCPYGQPGDRLWVREAWRYGNWTEDGDPFIEYAADGACLLQRDFPEEWTERLNDTWAALSDTSNYAIDHRAADRRWRPSIHMPRWAGRIMLEVTGIRVQRLQDISEDDAKAEGLLSVEGNGNGPGAGYKWHGIGFHGGMVVDEQPYFHTPGESGSCRCRVGGPSPAQCAFRELWDRINAKRASWNSNPWVWVVEFRRLP